MFVEALLPAARKRLVTIVEDASLVQAALLLRPGTDILVVCNSDDLLAGVVTKTDVVRQIGHCEGATCTMALSGAMNRNVLFCRPGDSLPELWARTRERGLKNIPFVDNDLRPLGVLNARDMLQALLQEVEDEEAMMRDYIAGIGYR